MSVCFDAAPYCKRLSILFMSVLVAPDKFNDFRSWRVSNKGKDVSGNNWKAKTRRVNVFGQSALTRISTIVCGVPRWPCAFYGVFKATLIIYRDLYQSKGISGDLLLGWAFLINIVGADE